MTPPAGSTPTASATCGWSAARLTWAARCCASKASTPRCGLPYYRLLTTCHPPLITHQSPPTAHHPLPITYHPSPVQELSRLSATIDPLSPPTHTDYYPLPAATSGERFPQADEDKVAVLEPVPEDRAEFLHAILHGVARVEAEGCAYTPYTPLHPLRPLHPSHPLHLSHPCIAAHTLTSRAHVHTRAPLTSLTPLTPLTPFTPRA